MSAHGHDRRLLPEWRELLGEHGYAAFVGLVRQYFEERGMPATLDEEAGVVSNLSPALQFRGTFGLRNLAQTCRHCDRDEWRDVVARHFDTIFDTQAEIAGGRVVEFSRARPLLRSRLFPTEVAKHGDEMIFRRGPVGTIEALTLDQPRSVRTVTRPECRDWGYTDSELLNIGRRNLLAAGSLRCEVLQVTRGAGIHAFSGDPYYAASHALVIEEYLPDDLPHGVLVGVPRRDVMLAHYVRSIGTIEVISAMIQLVSELHREGPGSISPRLYWYHQGAFVDLPYAVDGEQLDLSLPDDFIAVLDCLSSSARLS